MYSSWRNILKRRRPRSLFGNLIAFKQRRLLDEPANVRLRHSLASHLGRAGRYPEAIEEAERLVAMSPSFPDAKRLLIGLRVQRFLGF
jgi:hypothetical protein